MMCECIIWACGLIFKEIIMNQTGILDTIDGTKTTIWKEANKDETSRSIKKNATMSAKVCHFLYKCCTKLYA
jgi:hypothetical protein